MQEHPQTNHQMTAGNLFAKQHKEGTAVSHTSCEPKIPLSQKVMSRYATKVPTLARTRPVGKDILGTCKSSDILLLLPGITDFGCGAGLDGIRFQQKGVKSQEGLRCEAPLGLSIDINRWDSNERVGKGWRKRV